jgi:hypothetical protein
MLMLKRNRVACESDVNPSGLGGLVDHPLDLRIKAFAGMAAMALAGGKEGTSLFCRGGFDAPLFGARYEHGCMEDLQFLTGRHGLG